MKSKRFLNFISILKYILIRLITGFVSVTGKLNKILQYPTLFSLNVTTFRSALRFSVQFAFHNLSPSLLFMFLVAQFKSLLFDL